MPDENENNIAISELDEALDLTDSAQFPYTQNNGGTLTTFKARLTQIAAKIIEGLSFAGINLPTSAGDKTVENSINFLLDSVGGDPNGNISDSYDPTAAYVKGDLCIYDNVLYICTAPTTGTFDPSKWTATTIDNVIGDLSSLTTTVKSSLVGAVNEVNSAISYKEYVVQIGTSLWNGVYYAETNVATDVSNYGEILSALVIDESEQSDFSSHTNRACFCQVITPNVIRLYSPQASNASGHYVKYRVTFSANAVNRT